MKINDFIHKYDEKQLCRIRTFINSDSQVYIVITDLGTGNSVTNTIEKIIDSLISEGLANSTYYFIEHYEPSMIGGHSFDIINIEDGVAHWSSKSMQSVMKMIESPLEEFEHKTFELDKYKYLIERKRFLLDKYFDIPRQYQSPEIIKRKILINENKVSKTEIIDFFSKKPKEREILTFLKKDLSIMAEMYAHPDDEYICFNEFPFFNEYVDFVLFTGRSRLKVFLIEVKGADQSLIVNNSYENFNHKYSQAYEQIINKFDNIYRNYNYIRKEMHRILNRVIKNKKVSNHLKGPIYDLQVDSNKDVEFIGVIICGFSRNELMESKKRHMKEMQAGHPIKIETWDSFINKLQRN